MRCNCCISLVELALDVGASLRGGKRTFFVTYIDRLHSFVAITEVITWYATVYSIKVAFALVIGIFQILGCHLDTMPLTWIFKILIFYLLWSFCFLDWIFDYCFVLNYTSKMLLIHWLLDLFGPSNIMQLIHQLHLTYSNLWKMLSWVPTWLNCLILIHWNTRDLWIYVCPFAPSPLKVWNLCHWCNICYVRQGVGY